MIQMAQAEICQVPKILEFQYHHEQQLTAIITISNTQDRVVNFKIKSNRPELYLVKPMQGSIYRQQSVRITFKRKELPKADFQNYLRNPNVLPPERFLIQIKYNETDAIGREKTIVQNAYSTVRFRGSISQSANAKQQIREEGPSREAIARQKQDEINKLTEDIVMKQKELQSLQSEINQIHEHRQMTKRDPIVLKDVIILMIVALLAGLAF